MKHKQYKHYSNYLIYPDGRVYSLYVKRFLSPFQIGRDRDYLAYKLCHLGVEFTIQAYRLIAKTFIPNPENKAEVNHINGVKTDNRVENLEWNTHTENVRHSFKTGLNNGEKWQGVKHSRASFTKEEVEGYCLRFENGESVLDITGELVSKDKILLYNKLYRIYKKQNWQSISKYYNW